jgi:oligopeptidase A
MTKGDAMTNQLAAEIKTALAGYKDMVKKVKANDKIDWEHSIQPLEEAAEKLDRAWNVLDHENSVRNTPEIREIYETLLDSVTNFHTDLMHDEDLCKIYQKIKAEKNFTELDIAQQTIINRSLQEFKLSGVSLPPEQKHKFKKLYEKLSKLENNFSNNLLDSTESWSYHVTTSQKDLLDGVPSHVLEQAKQKAAEQNKSGWVFGLNQASYFAIMSNAHNRQLREEFYTAYNTRASDQGPMPGKWDNTPLIAEILQIRQELAELVGYKNYAEYSLVPKMAKEVTRVNEFLQDLLVKAKPYGKKEIAAMQEFARASGFAQELASWDIPYFHEQQRKVDYDINQEELRAYFPEPNVLQGLFKLAKKLFDINIEETENTSPFAKHERLFKVTDGKHKLRGHFYIDLYAREGKRGGAWMGSCVSRIKFSNHDVQTPIAYLNCNFAQPAAGKTGLLTHDDVITLFHEFGHTIHHVLTQIDYFSAAGLHGVEWDAVELPSQFMENWAWEWQIIENISKHVDTGEPLPRATFDKLLESKNFQSAMYLLRQLEFALFDLRIHQLPQDKNFSAHAVLQDVRKETAVVAVPPFNRFENSFSHIFAGGYSAGYYSYLWAEVLSCDAFDQFKNNGLLDNHLGKEFLSKILEKGGSQPAMELFVAFAGREPNIDALLQHHALA